MSTIKCLKNMSKEWLQWVNNDYSEEFEPYKDAQLFLFELTEISSQLMWDEIIENNPNFCWAVYNWFETHEHSYEKIINDQIEKWVLMD
jgi:hypothetical protein